MTKHVFITGGVVSSLGKGLTSASLALLLAIAFRVWDTLREIVCVSLVFGAEAAWGFFHQRKGQRDDVSP